MGRILLLIGVLLFSYTLTAQKEKILFSEAIALHLPKYQKEAKEAYRRNNIKRAEFLFDSLVNNCFKGSYLDSFKVRNLKGEKVSLENFKKPVFLITYASWIVPSEGEIPALNQLAAKYREEIDFVILFWDSLEETKKLSDRYHASIDIFYVDETENHSSHIVRTMKHSLGLPTYFLLSPGQKILDIRRGAIHPYGIKFEKSFNLLHKSFSSGISVLLLRDSSLPPGEKAIAVTP